MRSPSHIFPGQIRARRSYFRHYYFLSLQAVCDKKITISITCRHGRGTVDLVAASGRTTASPNDVPSWRHPRRPRPLADGSVGIAGWSDRVCSGRLFGTTNQTKRWWFQKNPITRTRAEEWLLTSCFYFNPHFLRFNYLSWEEGGPQNSFGGLGRRIKC